MQEYEEVDRLWDFRDGSFSLWNGKDIYLTTEELGQIKTIYGSLFISIAKVTLPNLEKARDIVITKPLNAPLLNYSSESWYI